MTRSPVRDMVVGIFVLIGLGAVGWLSIRLGGLSYGGPGGLTLFADFDDTGGLKPRAPVVIAGVKVGQVTGVALDKSYRARVAMDLDRRLSLPVDTTASIVTSGLLGDRYVELQVGGDEKLLAPGDRIGFTESAVIMERLLGRFVHDAGVSNKPEVEQ
jgi:phospholipid/cholesterol/gamma-HCH transport system substrate-binding protein